MFWDIMQHMLVVSTDISGQLIFYRLHQAAQEELLDRLRWEL